MTTPIMSDSRIKGISLYDLSTEQQEQILYYMINRNFSFASTGYTEYIDDNNHLMNTISQLYSDKQFSWSSDNFFSVRDGRSAISPQFTSHVFDFFTAGGIVSAPDFCWKYGYGKRAEALATIHDWEELIREDNIDYVEKKAGEPAKLFLKPKEQQASISDFFRFPEPAETKVTIY